MSPRGSRGNKVSSDIIRRLLSQPPLRRRATEPLVRLEFNMRDVYSPTHWAITRTPPAYDTPDEDVYLHGRNVALLSKAAVYAATRNISRIVARAAGRQSVSRRDAGISRRVQHRALARPGRADRDRCAVRRICTRKTSIKIGAPS